MEPRGRILIVDDEANARTALAELVRDEGYSVETAADGFKALPKLDEFAPDLVLTDLKMPGMDGIALMRKAREGRSASEVCVMSLTEAQDLFATTGDPHPTTLYEVAGWLLAPAPDEVALAPEPEEEPEDPSSL